MKGIILAGGNGTRLMPLTKAVNKHLLPVGGKPMLQHCVDKMVEAKITSILVVTGGEHLGGIAEFLGSGKDFGCKVTYRVQDEAGGIAQALALAEGFIESGESMCVLLGDNIFDAPLHVLADGWNGEGARVVLKRVEDPQRFGVATIGKVGDNSGIIKIVEKPENPESDFAVTGIYFYDSRVFDIIRTCKPSSRKELEITDVNNAYVGSGQMGFVLMPGWWTDAGTHESYRLANELVLGLGIGGCGGHCTCGG
jgi:glucose-1-phosphate thymidylyltransferase